MARDLTLYSYRRCPFAIRVRMTLHEKGIAFETVEEDLKNVSSKLQKMHPQAKVPVLVHGHKVIYESCIITEYLDECFPDLSLMPKDPALRMEVRLLTFWCNQVFKPDLDRFKYGTSRFDAASCEGVEERLHDHLQKINEQLQGSDWLVGGMLSLADIHIFPFVRQLSRINPRPAMLNNFSELNTWLERITLRPAFEKAMTKQHG